MKKNIIENKVVGKQHNKKGLYKKLFTVALALWSGYFATQINNKPNNLPNKEEIVDAIDSMGADSSYISNLGAKVRKIMPENELVTCVSRLYVNNGQSIKIYLSDSVDETYLKDFEDVTDYLNGIFEIINPEYKFEIVREKNGLDFLNPNFISVATDENVFPFIETITGGKYEAEGFNVTWGVPNILSLNTDYGSKKTFNYIIAEVNEESTSFDVKGIFLHEMMHALGLGDAYLTNSSVSSAMEAGRRDTLTKNDISLLIALYGDTTNPEKIKQYEDAFGIYFSNTKENLNSQEDEMLLQ